MSGGAPAGLSAAEVTDRRARGLSNDLPATNTRTFGQILRANLLTRFNLLLGGLLAVILVVGPLNDALFGGVLIANALIGITQEVRAKKTLDRLTILSAPKARVRRDGTEAEIPVNDVVLDDVLELQPGDQVVVDAEVVEASGLEIDEALLTGESDPVLKRAGDDVLSGSFVAAGGGYVRATRVGVDAYAVKLAADAKRFTLATSELRTGIDDIIRLISYAMVPTAALLLWSQLSAHEDWREAAAGTVAGVVAMVPEGLVLLTSMAFAAGVVRLGRRHALVQELPAVETLARVDVLCLDKTGTITEGDISLVGVEPVGATTEDEVRAGARRAGRRRGQPQRHPAGRGGRRRGHGHRAAAVCRRGALLVGPEVERGHHRRGHDLAPGRARGADRRPGGDRGRRGPRRGRPAGGAPGPLLVRRWPRTPCPPASSPPPSWSWPTRPGPTRPGRSPTSPLRASP